MKVLAALVLQALRRTRRLLIVACILLAGFQVVLILQANSVQANESFAQMGNLVPDFVREVMGALIAVSIALATVPVMEIENGFIDLVLARPLARPWIITRSIIVAFVSTLLLLAAMCAGTEFG